MTVNRYDQASRYAAKLDAVGFVSWLLHEEPANLRFRGWLDTRTLPFPGDPERTCDTVAWLSDTDPAVEWAIPIEFCTEPDGTLFGRLLVYEGQLWLEIRPTDAGGERFSVGAVVVNLTGRGQTSRTMRFRQTGMGTILDVVERNLVDENAAATLAAIAAGTLARCVLPWVPLMQRGEEEGIIQQWKELASLEPDSRRRSDYGGLALVFADAAGRRAMWKEALKEWNMKESQQVLEWINMGRAEGRTEGRTEGRAEGRAEGEAHALLRLLAKRFPPGAPVDLAAKIQATTELEHLQNWFDLAWAVDSLDAFRQVAGL